MSPQSIFLLHLVLGYVACLLCFSVYVFPALKSMDRVEAQRANRYSAQLICRAAKDAPQFRRTQGCAEDKVVEIGEVGGLHHHYECRTA